ncbi:hypothetical protein ACLM5H_14990 [Fredinandcohnia humi]
MKVNFFTILISSIVSFAIITLVTGQIRLGIIVGLLIGVGIAKWLRVKKQEVNDEIEFDERVNNNIKHYSLQTFSISNFLLLVYLLISDQILHKQLVELHYLIFYLSITFIIAFYIVPLIARNR